MSDGSRRIFATSGNGISPAPGPGGCAAGQLAESVIQLAQQANGTLTAQDFLSPANAPTLDNGDLDFGSGGPVGFPVGTTTDPDILGQGLKNGGNIFLLDPERPRRPRTGRRRYGRRPVPEPVLRRAVGPPGCVRGQSASPPAVQFLRAVRLHVLPGQERLSAGFPAQHRQHRTARPWPARPTAPSRWATPPARRWSPPTAPTRPPPWCGLWIARA